MKVPSLNNQEKSIEPVAANIAIFGYKQLITIVQTIVPFQNLVHYFKVIHYDKTTKFLRPRKMRRAGSSKHRDFLK